MHRILVPNTVEDRILALQEKKRELIEGALDEKAGQSIGRLGTRELAFLFVSMLPPSSVSTTDNIRVYEIKDRMSEHRYGRSSACLAASFLAPWNFCNSVIQQRYLLVHGYVILPCLDKALN